MNDSQFTRDNKLPLNTLHKLNFVSIMYPKQTDFIACFFFLFQGDAAEDDHEASAALVSALAALEGKKVEPVQKRPPSAKARS